MERAASRTAAAEAIANRAVESVAQASALGQRAGSVNEPLPPGLEEAARRATARSGSRQTLESALREQYGSTQP
jgi:hypothetical protein